MIEFTGRKIADQKLSSSGLSLFLVITFTFTWLILGLAALAANHLINVTLPVTLLITVATLGPAVGAFAAAAYASGRPGSRALLAQVGRWRVGWRWYVIALMGPVFIMLAGYLVWRLLGGPLPPAPPSAAWVTIPLLVVVLLIPALFEEVGWRGFVLPRLQSRYGWLTSSLIVGVVWAIWHAPIWFIPEAGFSNLPFPVFLCFTMALSLIMTWIYNGTGGSVLLTALTHAAVNAYASPWNMAVSFLPESTRGLHLQIPVTIVLAVLAFVLALLHKGHARITPENK